MNRQLQHKLTFSFGKQVLVTYGIFLFLVIVMAALVNLLFLPPWIGLERFVLFVRCFDLIELVIPISPIHSVFYDPAELIAAHLLLSHFYFSYGFYIYLKYRFKKVRSQDAFLKNNLSPFLLGFGIPMTLVGIIFLKYSFIAIRYGDGIVFFFTTGAYNIVGLVLQYMAFKNGKQSFLRMSVIVMAVMNVIGLMFCLYVVFTEAVALYGTQPSGI